MTVHQVLILSLFIQSTYIKDVILLQCDGSFAAIFFSESSIFRLCVLQREHDVLQHFVTSNIGVLSYNILPIDQSPSIAAVAATNPTDVDLFECVLTQMNAPFTPVRNSVYHYNNKSLLVITTYNKFKIPLKKESFWKEI